MVDQNSQFYAILTNVGAAKQANADALGIAWKITHMGVGDANGADPTPDATQTRLINEWRRAPLNQLKVDDKDASIIIAEQVIPADIGGKWIREIGLYDEAGDLVAVANCAPTYKPVLSQGSGRTQVLRMSLVVSSAANVQLKIDPSVVLATREWVTEELARQDFKHSVVAATTANITLSGLQTVDGVALTAGARVLVKNQTVAKDNGLYTVVSGAAWTRCDDANSSAKVTPGLLVLVERGTANSDSAWQLVTDAPITLGMTALTFEMAFGRTGLTAGTYRSVQVDKYGRVVAASNPTTAAGYGLTDVYTKSDTYSRTEIASAIATAVSNAVAGLVDTAPGALDTLKELAAAIGNDPNYAATMIAELAKKAPLDSPDFKGTPRVPTPAVGSTGLQAANMAALTAAVSAGSRQFKTAVIGVSTNLTLTAAQAGNAVQFNTGPVTLTLPATADVGNGASFMLRNPSASATQKLNVASAGSIVDGGSTVTEASIKPFEWMELAASGNAWFVVGRGKLKEAAELDSPLFTGDPKVPTPATSDNSKSAASTEFVRALIKLYGLGERYAGVITDIDDPTLGNGWYAVTLSTTAGTKPVGQTWGTVFVSGRSNTAGTNGRVMQTYFATDSATTRQLFRTYFNGEWTVWEEVSTLTAVKNALAAVGLGTGQAPLCADVDAQTTSGFFYLSTGSSANMPYATNGFLLHFPWNSSSAAMQIYVAASGDKFMYRAKSSGSWRPWKDVPSLDTVISTINNYSRSFKAQAALGLTTSQVLTSAHIGALIQFNANGLTVTLPSSSDVPDGSVMTLRNPRSTQQTLAVTVGSIVEEAATSSTMTLQAYEWVEFASSGSNWFLSARGKVKESATVEQLNSAAASAAPPGMVAHFALPTPPTGWIKRNGAAVSRTAYAALFAVIGTTFGAGDGSTTFNVPDDRELIDRSWTDGLNSADAGRALFSTQAGQLESHIHTGTALSGGAHTHTVPNKREYVDSVTTASVNAVYGDEIREGTDTTTTSSSGTHSHTLSINATGGNETRMANRAYLACIKY